MWNRCYGFTTTTMPNAILSCSGNLSPSLQEPSFEVSLQDARLVLIPAKTTKISSEVDMRAVGVILLSRFCSAWPQPRNNAGRPIHRRIRSTSARWILTSARTRPGVCSRCGMKLAAGIPDPVAFHLDLSIVPQPPKAGQPATMTFAVHDPWKDRPVKNFIVIHEEASFTPSWSARISNSSNTATQTRRATARLNTRSVFPKPGMFRAAGRLFPDGATPQLITKTVFVPGAAPAAVKIGRDYSTKVAENLHVSLGNHSGAANGRNEDSGPLYDRSRRRFENTSAPGRTCSRRATTWITSMMHQHHFIADGGPRVGSPRVVFPRPRAYRMWVQFQRNGVVNTVHFGGARHRETLARSSCGPFRE